MKLRHRLQEKLADRLSFIQYPNIRPADQGTRAASRSGRVRAPNQLSVGQAFDLVVFSLFLLAIGAAALAAVAFIGYNVLFK